jgi:hypothetical protein
LSYTPLVNRTKLAWIAAIVADALQIVFLPAMAAGFASPLNNALDVVMAIGMIALLGWHVAFLPTAIAEIVPALNIFPTWTAAVFFVTRGRGAGKGARQKDLPPGAR